MQAITTILDAHLPTLLLALHPAPSAAVVSGQKILEFRKRFYPDPFQAFVYTTGRGIQSFIRCGAAYQGSPATIAQLGAAVQGSDVAATLGYLGDRSTAMALPIQTVYRLQRLITLAALRTVQPQVAIPQTYTFLDRPAKRPLLTFLARQVYVQERHTDWEQYAAVVRNLALND